MFEGPAWLVSQYYSLTHNYAIAIALVAFTVMVLVTPLTLKSTKGMLEMQRLQPEMKRLQAQYRGDRQKLNEEMMKLYSEHKVNPLASCLPLLLQMPIFFIMYRVLHGLTKMNAAGTGFAPAYISHSSDLYKSLVGQNTMMAFGLDLSKTPAYFIGKSIGQGLVYASLVVALGLLYFVQQKMIASRAAVSPTMSATQAKIMQYLPVVFAAFQMFFLTGLVIYYMTQAIFRIGQNLYITRRFYGHEDSLGRQAQAAGARAHEEAKANGTDTAVGGGMFAQAKRDAQLKREAQLNGKKPAGNGRATTSERPTSSGKPSSNKKADVPTPAPAPVSSKRVTPPKNRPTPSASKPQRPTPSGRPAAPKPPKK